MSVVSLQPGVVVYEGQDRWHMGHWPPFLGENDSIPEVAGIPHHWTPLVGGPAHGCEAKVEERLMEIVVPLVERHRYVRDRRAWHGRKTAFHYVETLAG
jgi:hypothetical protein